MKSTYTAKKTILASSVFLGMALGTAHAERCFTLSGSGFAPPDGDIIRVSGINIFGPGPLPGSTHTVFVGSWISPGNYVMPIVGSRAFDLGSTTVQRYGFHGTANPVITLGGNSTHVCHLDGISGAGWLVFCDPHLAGGTPVEIFGATFAPTPCGALPPSVAKK